MDRDATADVNAPHSMGTTIIGVTYNGGVILGADSRTSTGKMSPLLLTIHKQHRSCYFIRFNRFDVLIYRFGGLILS